MENYLRLDEKRLNFYFGYQSFAPEEKLRYQQYFLIETF